MVELAPMPGPPDDISNKGDKNTGWGEHFNNFLPQNNKQTKKCQTSNS